MLLAQVKYEGTFMKYYKPVGLKQWNDWLIIFNNAQLLIRFTMTETNSRKGVS